MILLHSTEEFRGIATSSVVTIGVFDGIHCGHQAIMRECVEAAARIDAVSVVLTFDRNPRRLVCGESPCVITAPARKMAIIRSMGVDYAIEVKFDSRFAAVSAVEFCEKILAGDLKAAHVCVGENFRFGAGGAGDIELLAAQGERLGFDVTVVPLLQTMTGTVSSTLIRGLISEGNISEVERVLGRPYSIQGRVVPGHHRGKKMGFPTANLKLARHFCIPSDGVYAGFAKLGRQRYMCAVNIGSNPTFSDVEHALEIYLLDFEGEIYGESLEVEFHFRLRAEIAFKSEEGLVRQVRKDVEKARDLLSSLERAGPV